jgi:hypothetical protein
MLGQLAYMTSIVLPARLYGNYALLRADGDNVYEAEQVLPNTDMGVPLLDNTAQPALLTHGFKGALGWG